MSATSLAISEGRAPKVWLHFVFSAVTFARSNFALIMANHNSDLWFQNGSSDPTAVFSYWLSAVSDCWESSTGEVISSV